MNLLLRNSRIKLSQGQIFWREIGQGPVLVFLHGSWTDGSQWIPVIEHLSQDYHCVVPDLLGFGESECPKVHYSIELEVECLAELLEALHLRRVYLVGDSLGGWIASSYALKYLDRVSGIVLLAPEGVQAEILNKYGWWGRWLLKSPQVLLWLLRSLSPVTRLLGWQEKIKHLFELQQKRLQFPVTCQLLFQRRPAEIKAELLEEKLDWLKVPILILQGKEDTPSAIAQSQVYAASIPTSELLMIHNGGNNLVEELPEEIVQHIREFCQQRE